MFRDNRSFARRLIFLILPISGITVLLDQLSKSYVLENIKLHTLRPVVEGFFNLTLTFNRGAAFGFLSNIENENYRNILLGFSIAVAIAVVFFLLIRDYFKHPVAEIGLSFVLGGAIGNILDRFRYGAVVDFLDFGINQYHWPAFNIADSAITVGVVLLLFLKSPKKEEQGGAATSEGAL